MTKSIRFTSDDLKQQVLRCIKLYNTPQVRATRAILRSYTGGSDRAIRNAIEELRNEGEPIISDNTAGYYYSPAHVGVIIAELKARAYKHLTTARALERRNTGMQMGLGI